jgi:hypothetical protein
MPYFVIAVLIYVFKGPKAGQVYALAGLCSYKGMKRKNRRNKGRHLLKESCFSIPREPQDS